MWKVVVMGELCEDILMHNPESVEVIGKKVWAEDITVTAGGSAAYTASALSHLGVSASVSSVVGADAAGERITAMLSGRGVDCSLVRALQGAKTTGSMLICRGAEKEFLGCSPMLPMPLPRIDALEGADLLYIAGYMLYPELWTDEAFAFFCEVKRRGIRLALDGQLLPVDVDPIREGKLGRMLSLADIFFAARKEAVQILGRADPDVAGRMFLDMGCKLVVLKRGQSGCVVVSGNGAYSAAGYPIDAYDTVGSGDVFGAAFCYGQLCGWDIKACADFSTVFTALSLQRYDTYKAYPSLEDVKQCCKERFA